MDSSQKWYKKSAYIFGTFILVASAFALGNTTSQPQVTPVTPAIAPAAAVQAVTPVVTPESQKTVETVPAQETYSVSEPVISEPDCHPSYSGCLNPDASDYDCAGGSGNGPYYTGSVQVYGPDVFDLDRDGDGWGCE